MAWKKLILATVLVIVIFSSAVQADFFEDFAAYSQFSITETCSCAPIQDLITITNTGSVASGYSLNFGGTAAPYSSVSEHFIVLEPGESEVIYHFLNMPCGFEGELYLDINVGTNLGLLKTIKEKIIVSKCNNNQMRFLQGNSFTNLPCKETRYDLEIMNLGTYPDSFALSTEGLPEDSVQFTENPVTLNPFEKKYVAAFVKPSCDEYGLFEGKVTSSAQNSGFEVNLPFLLNIKQHYNYSIITGKFDSTLVDTVDNKTNMTVEKYKYDVDFSENLDTYSFCEGLRHAIPVRVSNDVYISNSYLLDAMGGQPWIYTDEEALSVHGNDEGFFNIVLDASEEKKGNYTIDLNMQSVRGDMKLQKDLDIEIEDCTSFALEMIKHDQTCCGSNTYEINVTNHGTKTNKILLHALGIGKLWEDSVVVDPGESKTVKLAVIKDCNGSMDAEHITISARVRGFGESRTATLDIDFVDAEACHDLGFEKPADKIFFNEYREREIILSNNGIRQSNYNLSLNAPEWMTLNYADVYLPEKGSSKVYIRSNPEWNVTHGRHNFSITAKADNGYVYEYGASFMLKHKSWYDSAELFLEAYKVWVILFILLLLLLVVWISHFVANMPKREKSNVKSKEKPKEKPVKTAKTAKIDKKPEKKLEKKPRKKSTGLFWLIFVIILLFLIGIAALYYGYGAFKSMANETSVNETSTTITSTTTTTTTVTATVPINTTTVEVNDTKGPNLWERLSNWYNDNVNQLFVSYDPDEAQYNLTLEDGVAVQNEDVKLISATYVNNTLVLVLESEGEKTLIVNTGELGCPYEVYKGDSRQSFTCSNGNVIFDTEFSRINVIFDFNERKEVPYEEQLLEYVIENNLSDTFQYHVWNKNKVYVLDLDPHFSDPDHGDELVFTSTNPLYVNATIDGSKVYLIPEENWHGVDYITFKASDSKGGHVLTPEVALIVRDIEDSTLLKLWNNVNSYLKIYLVYILFGLVILIIVVLVLSMGSKGKKKK